MTPVLTTPLSYPRGNMASETILYAVNDGIATITLSRPEKLNALTVAMIREFIDALDQADEDDSVRAVVVTGSGRAFCPGAVFGVPT